MVKRLIVGLVLGTVIGAVIAAILVQGMGMVTFGASSSASAPVFAYLAAAVTGVVTGLVAGKPIWSADGKIEAGLKAFFGVLLGLGGMFALRTWGNVDVNLSALQAGQGALGMLPAASLPIIAAVLAAFYEIDNSPADKKADESASASGGKKLGSAKKVRVEADDESLEDDELDEPVATNKKKSR